MTKCYLKIKKSQAYIFQCVLGVYELILNMFSWQVAKEIYLEGAGDLSHGSIVLLDDP